MTEHKPRLALDMYVLAQGVKTGVYRVCDELYARLARSPRLGIQFASRAGQEAAVADYLRSAGLEGKAVTIGSRPSRDVNIVLSPFGVAPREWRDDDENVVRAHIIYDLIAIERPEYFSDVAAHEVADIMASLDERTVIFAISQYTRQALLSHRPDLSPSQVAVIPLAAGDRFAPCADAAAKGAMRRKYRVPEGVPYVLSIATLEVRKNLDQVVEAFLVHLRRDPSSNMHLVLAGMSGWKLEKLEEALESASEFRDRIILPGFVDDAELSALYSDALCFVYLSRYEGFGLPPLEAMACGTPVICANNSSLPEVVGDAGILLDADDLDGVADAIERIRSSASEREALSRKGLERAKLFDWDRCTDLVVDTLLAAHARHVARSPLQRSQPWLAFRQERAQLEEAAIPLPGASSLGYENGAAGPVFGARRRATGSWPLWADTLVGDASPGRVEGGLRTRGALKHGSAGQPLVSYVTVVRNNKATLARTIESVQAQTYANVEHLVLDGASTDGTVELIESFGDRLDYYVSEPDAGLYDAVNKIIALARGQLICVLNSDDWLTPHAAEIAVHRMKAFIEEPALLASSATVCDASGNAIHDWHPAFVHPGTYFMCADDCHNAIYATRAAYEASGPYDSSYKITGDFKWIMSCIDAGVRFVYSRDVTVNYSLGGTSGDARKHSLECERVVRERFPFISDMEVRRLYECFFVLAHQFGDGVFQPGERTRFLQHLLAAHTDRPDFLVALGWAGLGRMIHPDDVVRTAPQAPPMSLSHALKQSVKSSLRRFPRLYACASRGYAWARR